MRTPSLIAALLAVLTLAGLGGPSVSARPLETSIVDYDPYSGPEQGLALRRTRAAGASSVKIYVTWYAVAPAPDSEQKPAGFNAGDPADPLYDWSDIDQQVRAIVAHGLKPLLLLGNAPVWAEGPGEKPQTPFPTLRGTRDPDPREYGLFARAAAKRYSGKFQNLPRVRLWQAWNEPNRWSNLTPQFAGARLTKRAPSGARPVSPDIYRRLLNRFADAVRGVRRDNLVITGGLGPFGSRRGGNHTVPPMIFMRELLCMNRENKPVGKCTRPKFDIWSIHPYTEGGPTHEAQSRDNVSLGDLPEVRRLLRAAIRADRIATKKKVRFWATEFSWDTRPPDKDGLPLKLHARWSAEALYVMWRNDITHVTWFLLRDSPTFGYPDKGVPQGGLYLRCEDGLFCDKPKPALTAFRFPFVAYRVGRDVDVWGRTPTSDRRSVIVEQRRNGGWRRIGRVRSDRHGIFEKRLRRRGRGPLRARVAGKTAGKKAVSLPFSLKQPRDRPAVIN
jgi:hypothetical protein